ncbi:MAG: diphosphomevalonate decarboxylase [Chloroflexi bacterium]|nr:diphosphomevalonate decarboxylase [Chloroflexota bacterium]
MPTDSNNIASARAHSNIAFIKYWGNRNHRLRLPANASLSMNLSELHTTTTVEWLPTLDADTLAINGAAASQAALDRVSAHLDVIRRRLGIRASARVSSTNNFPMGAGIASSASAFAALTLAAVAAGRANLRERELSTLARMGSGSAARSIPPAFVEWHAGDTHESSYAEAFVHRDHWALADVVAVVSRRHKQTGSTAGHREADSSVLQSARVAGADQRLADIKAAIKSRDFGAFAEIVEEDSNLMHAVMMTSKPPLFYWDPLSLRVMQAVRDWRLGDGLRVCYTLDAGPNVHCICEAADAAAVVAKLRELSPDIEILQSGVGRGACLMPAKAV